MSFYPLVLSFLIGLSLILGVYFGAKSIYVTRKADRYLYYAIATIIGAAFIAIQMMLTFPATEVRILLLHRLKLIMSVGMAVFWLMTVWEIFLERSRLMSTLVGAICAAGALIPFNFTLSFPVRVTAFGAGFYAITYSGGSPGLGYYIYVGVICVCFAVMIVKILTKSLPTRKKIFFIIMSVPLAGCLNDFLIGMKLYNGFFISEYSWLFFVLSVFIYFIIKDHQEYLVLRDANTALEHKVRERTREIELMNETLKKAATLDILTGLYNRREFQRRLEEEKGRIVRYHDRVESVFSVLFIDMDNFKLYNDRFGHSAGDLCLGKFSEIIRQVVRRVDFASRFGGDEFVIILPETNETGAKIVAERIIKGLSDAEGFVREIGKSLGHQIELPRWEFLSCSIGIASYRRNDNADCETIVKRADSALLTAKQMGKNRSVTWEEALV